MSNDKVYLALTGYESNDKDGNGKGGKDCFYLEIPMADIDRLCLKPRMYLVYLGWCILGLDAEYESLGLGLLREDGIFLEIDIDGDDLESDGIYTLLFEDDPPPGK